MVILVACGSRDNVSRLWVSDDAAIDSLSESLEQAYRSSRDRGHVKMLTDAFSRAVPGGDTAAALQDVYWRARLLLHFDDEVRCGTMVDSILELADSSRFPYEWSRLVSLKAAISTVPVREVYRLSAQNLSFYEGIGDSIMIGATLMRLGAVMWKISDTLPAASYYRRADTIFTRVKAENYRVLNLLNIANILEGDSSPTGRDSLMDILLHSPIARADTVLYHLVLTNCYYNTENPAYLYEAYRWVRGSGRPAAEATLEAHMADFHIGRGNPPDSVSKYAFRAYAKIDRVTSHLTRAMIFNAMAYTYYVKGYYDRAIGLYNDFLNERLAFDQEQFSLETTKAEYRADFEQRQDDERHRRARERMWLIVGALTAILILSVIVGVMYLRSQREIITRQRAEVELQRNRNHLSACALAIEEKDRIIGTVVRSVDQLVESQRIGHDEARIITMSVRQSLNNKLERETFQQLHEKLHPAFLNRLKRDYPTLTESQLRHAAYISMGMTSKQIAQAMNIEYESVKKSRTRLRQRMGLSPADSLEDMLRAYSPLA